MSCLLYKIHADMIAFNLKVQFWEHPVLLVKIIILFVIFTQEIELT